MSSAISPGLPFEEHLLKRRWQQVGEPSPRCRFANPSAAWRQLSRLPAIFCRLLFRDARRRWNYDMTLDCPYHPVAAIATTPGMLARGLTVRRAILCLA
jgi:hypothetical protein